MNTSSIAGYSEIEHTADRELHIWAADFPSLLEQSACGMYSLSRTRLAPGPRLNRQFEIPSADRESLLVDFLSELLFYGEDEQIAFDTYRFDFSGDNLVVQAAGAPIAEQSKEIKAVTYHRLAVRETESGLEVNIVFDV